MRHAFVKQSLILSEVPKTLIATAVSDGGNTNWPRSPGAKLPLRVYHCHGAPGIVSSLAIVPGGAVVSPRLAAARGGGTHP
jgi:hypothetical protein